MKRKWVTRVTRSVLQQAPQRRKTGWKICIVWKEVEWRKRSNYILFACLFVFVEDLTYFRLTHTCNINEGSPELASLPPKCWQVLPCPVRSFISKLPLEKNKKQNQLFFLNENTLSSIKRIGFLCHFHIYLSLYLTLNCSPLCSPHSLLLVVSSNPQMTPSSSFFHNKENSPLHPFLLLFLSPSFSCVVLLFVRLPKVTRDTKKRFFS